MPISLSRKRQLLASTTPLRNKLVLPQPPLARHFEDSRISVNLRKKRPSVRNVSARMPLVRREKPQITKPNSLPPVTLRSRN